MRSKLTAFSLGVMLALSLPLMAATFNLFQPANGILKGQTSTYVTTAAASSDVITLFSGTCNSSTFLRGDGSCAASGASFPLLAPNGSTSTPEYSFTTSPTTGLYLVSGGVLGITTGGTGIATLQNNLAVWNVYTGFPAATTGAASINLPHGTAPTSPNNGDVWTTTAGMFARINGSTVGPFSAGGGGTPGGADTQIQFNNMGSFGGSADLTWDGGTLFTNGFIQGENGAQITGNVDLIDTQFTITGTPPTSNYGLTALFENNNPRLVYYEDDAGANTHVWATDTQSGAYRLVACDDGMPTTCTTAVTYARSAGTPTTATFLPEIITPASSTTRAGLNLPHGTAPSSPTNGDVWTTTSGVFARVNGSTVGPFGSAAAAGSNTQVQFNSSGSFAGDAGLTYNSGTDTLTIGTGLTVASVDMTPATGTFTISFDVACTTTPTMQLRYNKIGSLVVITSNASGGAFNCTADSAGFSDSGTPVPAAIRPSTTVEIPVQAIDNGVYTAAVLILNSSGGASVSNCTTYGGSGNPCVAGWTSSGVRALNEVTGAYNINN